MLASRRARRFQHEIGVAQRLCHHRLDHLPTRREFTIPIEALPEKLLRQRVGDHVPRASVEGNHFIRIRARGNRSQVRDAADVLQHPSMFHVGEQHVIQQWNQRRSLAACHHVRGSKVRNHGNSSRCSNHRCLSELPCAGEAPPRINLRARLMIKSLPVTANQVEPHLVPFQRRLHRIGVSQSQPPVQARQLRR